MPIIEIKDLYFSYKDSGAPVLKNINLKIEKNEFIGIIGQTGSGKSTLVKQLNGLLKPDKGQVLLNGIDIFSNIKETQKARFKIGMVLQYPEDQLLAETVFKDIAFGPENIGLSQKEVRAQVLNAAKFVGLSEDILDRSPFEISGGEKRRVAIAGIIAMNPDVLVLDEPSASLDPNGRKLLFSQIKRYHEEQHKTVILISHNMEDIVNLADLVVVLENGEIKVDESTKKLFSESSYEELKRLNILPPNIMEVVSILRQKGVRLRNDILNVDDAVNEIVKLLKGGRP